MQLMLEISVPSQRKCLLCRVLNIKVAYFYRNRRGQFNELAQFSAQTDAGLDSIKNQILSRMSNIEARRRSSLEGGRQFTLDINKMPSQGKETV